MAIQKGRARWVLGALGALSMGVMSCQGPKGDPLTYKPADVAPEGPFAPAPIPTDGPSVDATGLYSGPESVAPYVAKFVTDAQTQGLDVTPDMSNPKLTIQIASLSSYGSSVIGLCESGSIRRVTFDPSFWNAASETQRELLAHHELGHCVLYRPHRTATLTSGAYASVMYPVIMASSTYLNNYEYYLNELFTFAGLQAPQRAASEGPNQSIVHICNQEELQ